MNKNVYNYYDKGLHMSWYLGLIIYQMFCNYYKTYKPQNNNFFDFRNYKTNLLIKCTQSKNIFTSLNYFIDNLEPYWKRKWNESKNKNGIPLLEEIKSCLYFYIDYYDNNNNNNNHFINWCIEGELDERQPFYKLPSNNSHSNSPSNSNSKELNLFG